MKPFYNYVPRSQRDLERSIAELQRIANERTTDPYLLLHAEDFDEWEGELSE